MNKSSTIRVSIDTKKRLNGISNVNDSYNTVISRLLDEYEKNNFNDEETIL